MTTQQQFVDLLSDIEPSQTTVDACSRAHATLRAGLATHEEFSKVHVETFLSGSYKRHTAIRPRLVSGVLQRPDVDVIVVTNHKQDDKPRVVLDAMHDALDDAGYSSLKINRRSIAVTLAGVDMDVVPIIEDGDGYLIPDVKLESWIATNPPAHTQWTIDTNEAAGRRFKPLVKLFKWWRREHLSDLNRPKGFILDCLVAEHMNYDQANYESLFIELLEGIRDTYRLEFLLGTVPFVEDPGVPGNNVFSNVTAEEFKTFYAKVEDQARLARRAKNESDDAEALKLWRGVMGPRFPASEKRSDRGSSDSLLRPAVGAGLTFPAAPVYPNKPAGFA